MVVVVVIAAAVLKCGLFVVVVVVVVVVVLFDELLFETFVLSYHARKPLFSALIFAVYLYIYIL